MKPAGIVDRHRVSRITLCGRSGCRRGWSASFCGRRRVDRSEFHCGSQAGSTNLQLVRHQGGGADREGLQPVALSEYESLRGISENLGSGWRRVLRLAHRTQSFRPWARRDHRRQSQPPMHRHRTRSRVVDADPADQRADRRVEGAHRPGDRVREPGCGRRIRPTRRSPAGITARTPSSTSPNSGPLLIRCAVPPPSATPSTTT